jgi:hypothetical protein
MKLVSPIILRYAPMALLRTNGMGVFSYLPFPLIPFVLSRAPARIEGLNGNRSQTP